MSERVSIKVPINKTYFNTFLNSYVAIYFFNDSQFTIESLKNLLFPPEHPDKEFNDLVDFINIVFNDLIRNNKENEAIMKDLNNTYYFDEEVVNGIVSVINTKRVDILNQLNSKFYENKNIHKSMHWSSKSILAASQEDHMLERYSDIEFTYTKKNSNKLEHKNITFTKNDFDKVFKEMKNIKENLKKINSIK